MPKNKNLLLINQPWLRDELTALGWNVITAGIGEERGLDFLIPDTGTTIEELINLLPQKPDRIVVFDDSSTLKIFGLERLEIPSIFYSVDAHHHSRWQRYLSALFDLTLMAQRQHIPEFETQTNNIKWYPLWPLRMPTPAASREPIVSFRGNLHPDLHPERAKFFNRLKEIAPVDASLGDWAEPYSKALMVINQTVGGDLNFRNFEAFAGGAMLLTPRFHNGFSDLFIEGEDYVSYEDDNAEDAGAKINYYLEHQDEALKIAASGRRKLLVKHTSKSRAEELSRDLEQLTVKQKGSRNISALVALQPTVISYKYRENNTRWVKYFEESLRLLNCAIEQGESLSEDFRTAGVFIILLTLVESQRFEELEIIGKKLLKSGGIDPIINVVFVVQALLNQNKSDEALSLAREYSHNPEELIASIPSLLEHVRELVMSSML